ncbi:MAG: hypothetical protein KAT62_02555 [Desulfuromonadales bacterium]|nr:hypothetical protein [Desulfuromonadales bacterium]
MKQTRLGSLIEAAINTLVGYSVALGSQLIIFPMVGVHIPLSTNILIGAWFTLISLVRGYIIRRWFNERLHGIATRLSRIAEGE